jgi:Na+-driven multidrug efflux pump
MYVMLTTLLLHGLWCYLFCFYYTFGVSGIAYATDATYFLNFVILNACVLYLKKKDKVLEQAYSLPDASSFSL